MRLFFITTSFIERHYSLKMMFYEIWDLAPKTRTIAMIKYSTNCHPQDCPHVGVSVLIGLCQIARKDLQDEIDCQILLLLFFQYLKKLMVGKKMILSNNGFLQNAYFSQL